jgi:hypothetical protein
MGSVHHREQLGISWLHGKMEFDDQTFIMLIYIVTSYQSNQLLLAHQPSTSVCTKRS